MLYIVTFKGSCMVEAATKEQAIEDFKSADENFVRLLTTYDVNIADDQEPPDGVKEILAQHECKEEGE